MKKLILALSFLVFGIAVDCVAENLDNEIREVAEALKNNTAIANDFGAHQRVVTSRLTSDGKVQRVEEKMLRTVWVAGKPANVLVQARCVDYEGPVRNSNRCVSFVKASSKSDQKPGKLESELKKVRWTELYKNFDFQKMNEDGPYRVIAFHPRTQGIEPQNRIEKILSKMSGRVWIDRNYNVVKADAKLVEPVSFGLGVAAKVFYIGLQYDQQQYQQVWLPAHLKLEFNAKVALVHTERQKIEVSWSDPYRQSDSTWVLRTGSELQAPIAGQK